MTSFFNLRLFVSSLAAACATNGRWLLLSYSVSLYGHSWFEPRPNRSLITPLRRNFFHLEHRLRSYRPHLAVRGGTAWHSHILLQPIRTAHFQVVLRAARFSRAPLLIIHRLSCCLQGRLGGCCRIFPNLSSNETIGGCRPLWRPLLSKHSIVSARTVICDLIERTTCRFFSGTQIEHHRGERVGVGSLARQIDWRTSETAALVWHLPRHIKHFKFGALNFGLVLRIFHYQLLTTLFLVLLTQVIFARLSRWKGRNLLFYVSITQIVFKIFVVRRSIARDDPARMISP